MKTILSVSGLAGLVLSMGAVAASDPVAWRLQPASGFPVTQAGSQSAIQYTLTNKLPFAAVMITEIKSTGGSFSVQDACKNTSLAPGASCKISVGFKPNTAANSTFQLIYGYHHNRIPLPVLTAAGTAQPSAALSAGIFGLPASFTQGDQPDFSATYTNTGNVNLTNCTVSAFTASTDATLSTTGVCQTPLTPGQSCEVQGQVLTAPVGDLIITGHLACDGGVTAAPTAHAIVENASTCTVHGNVLLPLPQTTYKYADNVVKFQFENECLTGTPPIQLGTVNISAAPGGAEVVITAPAIYDTCSNHALAAGENCSVTASIIPQLSSLPQNLVVTASVVAAGKTATASTSTNVLTNKQSQHHVKFVNQCNFDVWYGIGNGIGPSGGIMYSPDPNLAANPNGAPPSAYYLPKQVQGQLPSVIDLLVPDYQNGAIWARTGCRVIDGQFACATGTCTTMPGSATCMSSGTGILQPLSPYTKYEFTIVPTAGGDGVYDVSLVNGFSVPVEIKAFGPITTNNPFNCTGAGALIQPNFFTGANQLGACPWMFDPQGFSQLDNKDFLWVTPGADNACVAGSNCGMAYVTPTIPPGPTPAQIVRRQGDFLGYSALANYYGYSADGQWGSTNLYAKYGIGLPLLGYGNVGANPATWGALYACTPTSNGSADSCYLNGAGAQCCGCVQWQDPASPVPTASSQACVNTNPTWISTTPVGMPAPPGPLPADFSIQKGIQWLKQACPTAYSYQFDDKSSSFQCNNDGATPLMTSYQITFCPGGVTGKPDGIAEGRSTAP